MKEPLTLDPPTSMMLDQLPTTQVTSAVPQPGQIGCCGGGRNIRMTRQVSAPCLLRQKGTQRERTSHSAQGPGHANHIFLSQPHDIKSFWISPSLSHLCAGSVSPSWLLPPTLFPLSWGESRVMGYLSPLLTPLRYFIEPIFFNQILTS